MGAFFSQSYNFNLVNIYGKRLSKLEMALIFLFPLLFLQFFGLLAVPEVVRRLAVYVIVTFSIIYSADMIFLRRYKFNTIPYYFILLYGVIIFSALMALFSREQSLILSYRALVSNFLGYIYFFLLYKIKPHPQVLIKLIFVYAIIYVLCYIWGVLNAPTIVFFRNDGSEEIDEGRGAYRLRLNSISYVVLAFFYSIVKAIKNRKWYILSVITYVFIVLSLTRQTIVASLLITSVFIVWKKVWLRVIVAFVGILALTMQNITININADDSTVIGSLINLTLNQAESQRSGSDDIRVSAFNAYILDYHQNTMEMFFGSGLSHENSRYGEWFFRNFMTKGYIRADVGYASTYATFGIVGLLIFLLMLYKGLSTKCVGDMRIFANMVIFFVLITNIAGWSFRNFAIELSICMYLLMLSKHPISHINNFYSK